MLGRHRLLEHRGFARLFGVGDPLFQAWNDAVFDLAGPPQIPFARDAVQFDPCVVQLLLQVALRSQLGPFGTPFLGQLRRLAPQPAQLGLNGPQPFLRRFVRFLLERLGLDLLLEQLPVDRVELLRLRIDAHAQPAGSLVHKIDRLVREKPVGDVAVRKRRRRDQRRVGYPHAVVQLVLLLDPAQDRNRVFHRRLLDHERLEPAGQGGILFDVLPVLVQGRRADAVKLASGQGGLQQIGGVHGPFGLARADQRMHFVDEHDDFACRAGDLRQHALQAFFEFAAVLRPGDQRSHVERQQPLVLEAFGHVSCHDPEREALCDLRLAHPRLADQHRVVLGPAADHLHRAADFVVPAYDRIDPSVPRVLGNVARVPFERFETAFRRCAVRGAPATHLPDYRTQLFRGCAQFPENIGGAGIHGGQRHKHPLRGNMRVACFLRKLLRLLKHLQRLPRGEQAHLAARDRRLLRNRQIRLAPRVRGIDPRLSDQANGVAVRFVQQRLQQVHRLQLLMAFARRNRVRGLDYLSR